MKTNILLGSAVFLLVVAAGVYFLIVAKPVPNDISIGNNAGSSQPRPLFSAHPTSQNSVVLAPLKPGQDAKVPTARSTSAASIIRRSAEPTSVIAGHHVEYPGQFVAAAVRVAGKDYQVTPNQLGSFPRILVPIKGSVHVEVSYPDGHPGDAVVVESEDGGTLDGKKMANVSTLDARQSIAFNLQTTEQPGIYHVALRNGSDTKVFNFWAGPEPKIRQ